MTQTNLPVATVVLVHAAWADASSWNKIIPPLQRRGLQAVAVQIPLSSLSDDAATLQRFLKRVSGPVVLVGHSYGGAVITAAGSGNPNVKALVYIAAMAPDLGETLGEVLHRAAPHASAPAPAPDQDGLLWMSAKGFTDAVSPESSAGDALLMAATQKPIAIKSIQEQMTKPAWKEKPSWFLVAERAHDRPRNSAIHGSSYRRPDSCGGSGPHSTCLCAASSRRDHHTGSRCCHA
jgi:pimeloyl-ACP methyl ester carboxylesterase